MNLSDLSPDDQAVFHLAFRLHRYHLALASMDEIGDRESALLIDKVQRALTADQLGEELLAIDFIAVADGLLAAYDKKRESKDRRCYWQLRHTIDSLFELRSAARSKGSTHAAKPASATPDSTARTESMQLEELPLAKSMVLKLSRAGCSIVKDLDSCDWALVQVRAGLTPKQATEVQKAVALYLASLIPTPSLSSKRRYAKLFTPLPTLAHVLMALTIEAESHWRTIQKKAVEHRYPTKAELAKIDKTPFDFWSIGVTLSASVRPTSNDMPLLSAAGHKVLGDPALWEWLLEMKLATWNDRAKKVKLIPAEIPLAMLCKLADCSR